MMRRNRAYAGLDRFRLLAAFLVIAIHISPLETINGTGDFILTRIIGRTAVPFFFMTSGFFLEKDVLDPAGKRKEFVKKLLMLYGISILLYLPLNVYMGYFRETLLLPVLLKDLLFKRDSVPFMVFPGGRDRSHSVRCPDQAVRISKSISGGCGALRGRVSGRQLFRDRAEGAGAAAVL